MPITVRCEPLIRCTSHNRPAPGRGMPRPLDKASLWPGGWGESDNSTLENLWLDIPPTWLKYLRGFFLVYKRKRKRKAPTHQMGFQKLVSKLLHPESFEGIFCLSVFTFCYEIFQNYLERTARYWSLSFSSCEFKDYLVSSLSSPTSPTPSPGLFWSKSHISYHLISKFNGFFFFFKSVDTFFFFLTLGLFIYLFIYGCVGSSFLCKGFL